MRCLALSLLLVFASLPALGQTADTPPTLSEEQIRALIREAADHDIENDKRQRDYTYIEREEEHKLNGTGETKSVESKTHEVMVLYDEPVERLIAKNDKPLSPKEAAKEEERIQKIVDKRKNESESDRKKRLEKQEKEREDDREFVTEVNDAYNFRLAGIENLNGRDAWVIDAEPRPGFEPHRKEARILPKFRFRVWIDKQATQWVKLEAQCVDTVSFGWFLARIHKGSNIEIGQVQVNDEVWLPKYVSLKLDARVALLANINVEENVTYRDYRKFRADTKIVPVGEVQK
jgi:hypothetical protein